MRVGWKREFTWPWHYDSPFSRNWRHDSRLSWKIIPQISAIIDPPKETEEESVTVKRERGRARGPVFSPGRRENSHLRKKREN